MIWSSFLTESENHIEMNSIIFISVIVYSTLSLTDIRIILGDYGCNSANANKYGILQNLVLNITQKINMSIILC